MARIPNYMLWYRGERVSDVHVFTLATPVLAGTFNDDETVVTVTITNRLNDCIYLYTTDGGEPVHVWDGDMTFTDEFTLRVVATRRGERSPLGMLTYEKVNKPVATFTHTSEGGQVTLSGEGDSIEYKWIPKLTLHNRVTEDTSDETTVTNNGYPAFTFTYDDTTVVGRRYYLRGQVKYTESNRNFNQLWLWLKTGNSDAPARIQIFSNRLADIDEYNLISGVVYTEIGNIDLFDSGSLYWGPTPTETDSTMTSTYRHVMCIDLTDLYAAFPSFAELSDAEQTAILDALPYFTGDLTLGGALTNLVSNANNIEGEWVAGTPERYNNRRIDLSHVIEIWSASVYSRCDMKYVKLDSEAEDYDWMAYYWGSGTYESHFLKDVRPDVEYLNVSGIKYHKTPSALERVYYGYMYAGYAHNVFGKQMFSRNVICIDLGTHGHYFLYRLLGMDDDAIKAYLDTLPFFTGTYEDWLPWNVYSTPIVCNHPCTIQVVARKEGYIRSDVLTYESPARLEAPTITVEEEA